MAGSPFLNRLGYGYAAFVAVVPSDTVNQLTPFSALICSVGGTVSLVVASLTLAASVIYRLPTIVRVNITGTSATGLVGVA